MPTFAFHQVGLEDVRNNRGWYLSLGIALMFLGFVAIGRTYMFTAFSAIFIGWLMIGAGVLQALHACWKERGWGGFFLDVLTGILYVVVGFMVVANPAATTVALTLMIAIFLLFEGIFRMVAAVAVRQPNSGWVMLSGAINALLGYGIWRQWPLSGLWVIGLFVGIHMLLNGWSLVMLANAAKNLPVEAETQSSAG
jgi:uncharacterized membrane protein HdeD (DUF308 family)